MASPLNAAFAIQTQTPAAPFHRVSEQTRDPNRYSAQIAHRDQVAIFENIVAPEHQAARR
jgi:hypothetical protein